MSSENIVLKIDKLSKAYPGVKALDEVSMDFREGEVHAIVGENGAGKSTLIKAISGYHAPDSGTITVYGKAYQKMTVQDANENGIQVIYQEFVNVPALTAAENVYLGVRTNKGLFVDYQKRRDDAKKLFDQLGVKIDPDQIVATMSPAQMQIVEIAKSVSKDVRILVMDEPTAPLTVDEVSLLFKIIKDLKAKGVTVIYISHRLEEIFEISDRITVMRDGKCVDTIDTKAATHDGLIAKMVGREVSETCPKRDAKIGEEVLRVEHLSGNGDHDISFTLHKGEVLGFGGLVGAGRTELMELLFGAAPKEAGKIFLKGKEIDLLSPADAISAGIGFVPEDRKAKGVFLGKDIAWNSTINVLRQYTRKGLLQFKAIEEYAKEAIGRFHIKSTGPGQQVGTLSGGNQQKVVLAKTMAAKSDIVIFDEPTRGIDVGAKQEIYELMNELIAEGKSILMVSSDMPELLGMCDRIAVISEGHLTGILDKAEFDQEKILALASISMIDK